MRCLKQAGFKWLLAEKEKGKVILADRVAELDVIIA
jgi:hypothetical protein